MSSQMIPLPRDTSATAASAAPRVLVVDDVQDNREILTRRLVRRGFEVVEASGGLPALEAVETQRFDLVLLDIMMPDMSGHEVLRRIRQTRSQAELPIVMVSAKSESADVVACLEDGANDYVTKPVDFAIAFARIQTQISRKQAFDTARAEQAALETRVEEQRDSLNVSQDRLRFLAYHDALTQLPNRSALREHLGAALARSTEEAAVLLFLDLDNFKAVNDERGHEVGDVVLAGVAERLAASIRAPSFAARLGGDEFAIVLEGADAPDAERVANTLVERLCQPFELDGFACEIGASCGLALLSPAFGDIDEALNAADTAMYAAKADGKRGVKVFHPAMLEERRTRRILEMDLRHAVQDGCLELNFQPLFDARTAKLKSFEALVRWHHPTQGTIAPDQFIPLAEETGLIVALGDWVLREACTEAAEWPEDIGIAVNVSALQVGHGEMLPVLINTLAATGLSPSRLELEITESSLLALKPETVGFLRSVQELGVRVSIDDFGTGYSSMSSLQNFRFDKIKIDRSFVQAINGDAKSVAIIKSILELSSKIGVTTTAEGVETSAQLDYITANGCTEAQGFLFAKPMTKAAAREFIRQNV